MNESLITIGTFINSDKHRLHVILRQDYHEQSILGKSRSKRFRIL